MQRKKSLISILLVLLLLMAVSAASAQDDSEIGTCSAEDIQAVVAAIGQIAPQMAEAAAASPGVMDTDQLATTLAAWGSVYVNYYNDVYPNFPRCADSVMLADVLGLLLNAQVSIQSMALLNTAQTDAGDNDAAVEAALKEMTTGQTEMLQAYGSSFQGQAGSLQQGPTLPSWLPACTDEQNESTTELDEIEAAFIEQQEALQAYLDEGTVDTETYLAVIGLITRINAALKNGDFGCAELYERVFGDVLLFNDVFSLLSLGQALPYLAESDNAEALTALHDQLATWVGNTISPEESTE
jgi:hypothetical protein